MYYRKTRNKLIACILLLAAVMCISANKSVLADTSKDNGNIFSPICEVGRTDKGGGTEFVDLVKIDPANSNVPSPVPEDKTPEPVQLSQPAGTPQPAATPRPADSSASDNGKILIYHTHTNEAYLSSESERSVHLASRSSDASLTVKAVGEAMKNGFASWGRGCDHDITNNEAQGYGKAYKMSYVSVDNMIEKNGKYAAYLDVHRDAYISGTVPTVNINGENVARIMLVIGGKSPHAEQNHAFARKVMEELNKIHPQLCEKVLYVQSSGYNMIESDNCMIVEVGDNNVTVQEACRAAEYVAEAVSKVLNY